MWRESSAGCVEMSHWQLWFAQHALDYSGGERYKCHTTTLIDHMCTSVYNSHDYKLYITTLRNTLQLQL